MHVISRSTLRAYWQNHREVEEPLKAWLKEAEHASWKSFQDIRWRYQSAKAVTGNRVVFHIKGNQYRLVVEINYNVGIVFIRFVGTHSEYDRIKAEKI